MKTLITSLTLLSISLHLNSQTVVADFENLTLPTNTFYLNTSGNDWQTANAEFRYSYSGFWSGGYAYTNKKDSSTAGFSNLYGCKALNGFNNSNYYVTAQPNEFIKLKSPANGVSGFYITNSTYAYKSMKSGDQFAKKFGGVSGNDPDFFKLTVRGYKNGVIKTDSVEFYLADFRNSNNSLDYIIDNWQWVNTSSLNQVDSIIFFLYSSDVGQFGMNTPSFFCLDNFTTVSSAIGLNEWANTSTSIKLYPNPAHNYIELTTPNVETLQILAADGRLVKEEVLREGEHRVDVSMLPQGIYNLMLTSQAGRRAARFIKD